MGVEEVVTGVPTTDIALCHWAQHLLIQNLGITATARNITTFVAWGIAEGGWFHNDAKYNPLNTTQPFHGSHPINSVGVQAYQSEKDGFAATAKTLKNGYYPAILDGLRKNLTPTVMSKIVGDSLWGTDGALMLKVVPRASRAVSVAFPG